MHLPSPALVSQQAVRRLPRWVVVLLCAAYVLAGFVGRQPWREADMETLGLAHAMALGDSLWLAPALQEGALLPQAPGLLHYWLGAAALWLAPASWPADTVLRLPFMGLLVLCMLALWWAVYGLARLPSAQPVAFAFGGEAHPKDYACTLADSALLALLACLGLAQMGHEASHSLLQLAGVCISLYALGNMGWQPKRTALAALLGSLVLALSGAILLALGLGAFAIVLALFAPGSNQWIARSQRHSWAAWWLLCLCVAAAMALRLGQWPEAASPAHLPATWLATGASRLADWDSLARLLTWFAWPAWPFALWTLWRWRAQLRQLGQGRHLHLLIPLWLWLLALLATIFSPERERSLLLSLPAIAALAAFALPTLQRSLSAFIDWLTLIFFTACALTVWVVWLSVQTGIPAKPAANVARLADGYQPPFELLPFAIALLATAAWLLLLAWRTRRHRAALWKNLALPAGGTVLGWVLLMTLWLPMLDYGRSYAPQVQRLAALLPAPPAQAMQPTQLNGQDEQDGGCLYTLGMNAAQVSALAWHGGWQVRAYPGAGEATTEATACPWLVTPAAAWGGIVTTESSQQAALPLEQWQQWHLLGGATRPTDRQDHWLLLQRRSAE